MTGLRGRSARVGLVGSSEDWLWLLSRFGFRGLGTEVSGVGVAEMGGEYCGQTGSSRGMYGLSMSMWRGPLVDPSGNMTSYVELVMTLEIFAGSGL